MSRTIPRGLAIVLGLVAWLVAIPLVHGVLPWFLATLAECRGWTPRGPGPWNWIGLVPVAAGVALLGWALAHGLARAGELPERMPIDPTPPFLMARGPYAVSRNPMYVAFLGLWTGWAIFYGSVPVAVGLAVFVAVLAFVVPWEERGLEAHFGDDYRRYKARVPRWLGRR